MNPKYGDVLVSNPTATVEHDVSIVPGQSEIICPNHATALARGDELARERGVDLWLTEDHTHFMRIATYREEVTRGSGSG